MLVGFSPDRGIRVGPNYRGDLAEAVLPGAGIVRLRDGGGHLWAESAY
jgi:hypothetical protein